MSSEEIRPPAAYLRLARDGASGTAGSSNLTLAGFRENIEWNYYTSVEVNLLLDGPSPFHRAVSEFASYYMMAVRTCLYTGSRLLFRHI